jgi:hypothetical protein
MRRTMEGPQVRMGPPLSLPELSRASTVPIPTTQRLYPLPKDEESVFRPSPVKSATIDSPLPKLKELDIETSYIIFESYDLFV